MSEPRLLPLPAAGWPLTTQVGDPGAHRFTAMTWRAVADPTSSAHLPTLADSHAPVPLSLRARFDGINHPGAVWVSALQLAMFSLGWQSPAFGLYRWMQEGFPTEDPRLEVIAHLIGPDVTDSALNLLSFLYLERGRDLSITGPACISHDDWRNSTAPAEVGRYATSQRVSHEPLPMMPFRYGNGETDPCHISPHTLIPIAHGGGGTGAELLRDESQGRAVFIAERYAAWYAQLHDVAATLVPRHDGRSWRVDVVVKPVGWLGTYRLSRLTGRWFAGPHSIHEWGSSRS